MLKINYLLMKKLFLKRAKNYKELFDDLDKDKDGTISKEEFREVVKKGPLPSKKNRLMKFLMN